MKKLDKKKIAILIAIIAIIAVIVAIVIVKTKKKEKPNDINRNIEVGEFKTEIDMTDTENSEIREDGMKINTSNKIAEGIEFNDVKLQDIKIESSGDMAVFNAMVKNDLGKDIEGYIIYLTFLNKDGEVIDKVETFFPDIPKDGTGYISATTPKDIATAYEIQIERDMR